MDIVRPSRRRPRRIVLAIGAAVAAVALVAWASVRGPAVPTIARGAILIDSVRRGDVTREVRGTGTLVPERLRFITAQASARVERLGVLPGATVAAGDLLLELSNPDLQIQAMQAEQQVRQAEMTLLSMQATLEGQLLTQHGVVATTTTQALLASQDAEAMDTLAPLRLASTFDVRSKRALRDELSTRLRIERERLVLVRDAMRRQLAAQREQVAQLRAIAQRQRDRLQALAVRAPEGGVLQGLALQVGQWVPEGTTLATVVQPGRLKALLRVAETQAQDVAPGQAATVDTRNGVVRGHVARKEPAVQAGAVVVEIALDDPLPRGAVPDLSIDGTIVVERMRQVLYTGRPVQQSSTGATTLYKLLADGRTAVRTTVRLGRSSVDLVEVTGGLAAGDRVIVSDMSPYTTAERVQIR
ncbi:MAG: HlyD family efflux transporter periplasmic adaptor subunit [Gemmatimonadaceae bacterium]|jgi:multidrug resistance efflux pump|nr:HlyD family efflux transporter periplasmic adaptor subunit [Gemmatimonadaceae bacterium]